MKREQALQVLRANRDGLKAFSVRALFIFGSVARDEATESSDLDVLVEFETESHAGFFGLIRLKNHLEDLLGCRVDLTTPGSLRREMREQILKEAIRAA